MRRILASTRYIILIPVLGAFLVALALLLYGGAGVVTLAVRAATDLIGFKGGKNLALIAIEVIDLFLLGTAAYMISLGLYDLFIDDTLPMPEWLEFHDFDALKGKLIGVIVVLMSVLFLGQLVSWKGGNPLEIVGLGAAIALVIAALTYYLNLKH